jgi:hypothetical protein
MPEEPIWGVFEDGGQNVLEHSEFIVLLRASGKKTANR